MNNFLSDIENPHVRRPLIVLTIMCVVPFLLGLFVAEVIWETAKVMIKIIKTQIKETTPTFQNIIEKIKEVW